VGKRVQELIDFTKGKFGLDIYYLQRDRRYRSVNIFNETASLCMEWFPNQVTEHEDDDSNPEGTAVIDIDVHSRKARSVIFVEGKYVANGITFNKWIENRGVMSYAKSV